MNKTNHPMLSNSYPSATANKAIHFLKSREVENQREHNLTLTTYETIHPTAISENYSDIYNLQYIQSIYNIDNFDLNPNIKY